MSSRPSPLQIGLAVAGLLAVAISTVLAFINPFGYWHWVLLVVALVCMFGSRRLR